MLYTKWFVLGFKLERCWKSLQIELILGFKTGQIMEVASLVKKELKTLNKEGMLVNVKVIE